MTFAVSAPDMTLEEVSWFVDDTVTRGCRGAPGSAGVDRYGGADREIRVELDPVKLESFGITAAASARSFGRRTPTWRRPRPHRRERAGDPHAGRRGDA